MEAGYSPGRLRIFPNSLSPGSISMRAVPLLPGACEGETCFVSEREGLGARGKAGGWAGGGGASPGSLSAGSGLFPGMYQFLRLSSHPRYRCTVHMPCSAPVSRQELILKNSRLRMKFFTA